ncbi:hypothetical protein AVEN_108740-1 [Araneus ventricosus]|uniref:Uncharacterized protein n=1 Tax=Araneus ventricosus TaxID=182803 RepID=A0A4Y2FDQ9_ARAVE|nr:hypothetical protein AVEN_108740-1 [Araneus ventricosus]
MATLIRMVIHIEITSNTHPSDSRCDSLSSEARGLIAFTATDRTLPLEASLSLAEFKTQPLLCSLGSETPLTYPAASHPRTHSATSGMFRMLNES